MLPQSTLYRSAQLIKVHEGVTRHIYLDTVGLATFGVGFRPPLDAYVWLPNIEAARADLRRIESMAELGVHTAGYYLQFCNARLDEKFIDSSLINKLDALGRLLSSTWRIEGQPIECQLVLLDMAYNLGVAGLNKFAKLRDAVLSHNWLEASKQCSRKGIGTKRNTETANLFLSLVQNV